MLEWLNKRRCEDLEAQIELLRAQSSDLNMRLTELRGILERTLIQEKDYPKVLARLEELEIWRAKIHNMLVETTPATGKEKPSLYAKKLARKY